jgi:hypothetical protein
MRQTVIPTDVEAFIARKFSAEDRKMAARLLEGATIHDGSPAEPRLVRCAAVASAGSLEKLRYFVDLLKIDFRDVIMAGEYTPSLDNPVRIRDLHQAIRDEA